MKTTQSIIKTDEQGYNNMPAQTDIERMLLNSLGEESTWRYVDTDRAYWENSKDTVVIEVDHQDVWRFGEQNAINFGLGLADFLDEANVDEFHHESAKGKTVIRFWWD